MKDDAPTGRMQRLYQVTCGYCERTSDGLEAFSPKHARSLHIRSGWRFEQKHGWVCPGCWETITFDRR